MSDRQENARKAKILYRVFGIIIAILFIMITCPPIVAFFDRNDIWIGSLPLSQFYIFAVPLAAAICMAIMYFFDTKFSSKEEKESDE